MPQDRLILSNLTVDYEDYKQQINRFLSTQDIWKGEETTQTSQTLVGLVSTIATHNSAQIIRASEDAYAETAQSDAAIRSITSMQGIRLTRKSPAVVRNVRLSSTMPITIPPYTQMSCNGVALFNRKEIKIELDEVYADLHLGTVRRLQSEGIGADYQSFVAEEADFRVSNDDVSVIVGGNKYQKSFGGLWNFKGKLAFQDLTLPDGRLLIMFGNRSFGGVPQRNETIHIQYVLTDGESSNNVNLIDGTVTVSGFDTVSGVCESNPLGGANEKPIIVYKNVASGSFGTNLSAVTKSHYQNIVTTYPGVLDAVTQAQREINPLVPEYMNVIRVAVLTNTPWDQQMMKDFLQTMQEQSMYAGYFKEFSPLPIDRDVEVDVYTFNTAQLEQVRTRSIEAIENLFKPQPGLLMTNFYNSDLISAIKKANPGDIDHVIVKAPTEPMIVTAPSSADVTYEILPGGGTIGPSQYAYSVAVTDNLDVGAPDKWVFPLVRYDNSAVRLTWRSVPGALSYRVYGRISTEGIGLIAELPAQNIEFMEFLDDGTIVPTGGLPNTIQDSPIRYNRLRSLTVNAYMSERQQKLEGIKYEG